jgi:hypothetical protein
MNSATPSRRPPRARPKARYREPSPSSSSGDDLTESLRPFSSRLKKRKREDNLRQTTRESLQPQDHSKPEDSSLGRYHSHTSSIQLGEARRESDTSACSLPSDVPIFPYLEGRRCNSQLSNSSSWTLPSDVPYFPYLREERSNTGGIVAAQPPSLSPCVVSVPYFDNPYLRYPEIGFCREKEDSELDIFLPSKREGIAETVEVENPAPICLSPSTLHDQGISNFIDNRTFTRVTTSKSLHPQTINIDREGSMAPGVSCQ